MDYYYALCSPCASGLLEGTGEWSCNLQGVTCTHAGLCGGTGGEGETSRRKEAPVVVPNGNESVKQRHLMSVCPRHCASMCFKEQRGL